MRSGAGFTPAVSRIVRINICFYTHFYAVFTTISQNNGNTHRNPHHRKITQFWRNFEALRIKPKIPVQNACAHNARSNTPTIIKLRFSTIQASTIDPLIQTTHLNTYKKTRCKHQTFQRNHAIPKIQKATISYKRNKDIPHHKLRDKNTNGMKKHPSRECLERCF